VPSLFALLALLSLAATAAYWLEAMRGKELARAAARRACEAAKLQFLDDTVVQTRVRLRRDAHGRIAFQRHYRFEFTDGHDARYRGHVTVLGRCVLHLSLGA
jgi:hypothetical protein